MLLLRRHSLARSLCTRICVRWCTNWVTNVSSVGDVCLHCYIGLEDGARPGCLPVHGLLTGDQHAAIGSPVGGDERLGQEIVHPLGGDVDCLGTDYSARLLVQPLGTYVQHHLLNELRSQADEDAKEEVSLNLLLVLQ